MQNIKVCYVPMLCFVWRDIKNYYIRHNYYTDCIILYCTVLYVQTVSILLSYIPGKLLQLLALSCNYPRRQTGAGMWF